MERQVCAEWRVVLCCDVLSAVLCCAVLCCAVLCCAVLCCAVLSCAVGGGGHYYVRLSTLMTVGCTFTRVNKNAQLAFLFVVAANAAF